jgi:hypothetical protein
MDGESNKDRELWKLLYSAIKRAARQAGRIGRRPSYGDVLIVAMYLWCVWHDRPLCWACDRHHYTSLFRPRRLPSVSQFCRRVKEDSFYRILQLVHDDFAQRNLCTPEGYIDGKPLLVSPVSKDKDARRGKISGGFAKGYKLHAFVNENRRIVVWSVTGLNEDEKTVALHLLEHLPPMTGEALLLKDSNYDSAPLHKAAAQIVPQAALVGPLKGQRRVGKDGHHPVTLRQMGPQRRELLQAWQCCPGLVKHVMKSRDTIERVFGVLCCTAGGLGTALPSWVRSRRRVTPWVGTKIILYNARLALQDQHRNQLAA